MSTMQIDQALVKLGLASSRSQADKLISLNKVSLKDRLINDSSIYISRADLKNIKVNSDERYVSRAAYKLDSISKKLSINFKDQIVLDVGSSTGGFSDYALQHGAKEVIAVDKGSNQMDHKLRSDPRIDLHEKTNIINFKLAKTPNLVIIDVSFISIREVIAYLINLVDKNTLIISMVKPQFEVGDDYKNRGIVKNEKIRRQILADFEKWARRSFVIVNKADSEVSGAKGNVERFYLLKLI